MRQFWLKRALSIAFAQRSSKAQGEINDHNLTWPLLNADELVEEVRYFACMSP